MSAPRKPMPPPDTGMAQERLLLSEVLKLVGRSLAPDVVVREMLHLLSELLGLNRGRLVLLDEFDQTSSARPDQPRQAGIQHAYGLTRDEVARGRYQVGEGSTGRVRDTGQSIIVQDLDQEPRVLFRTVPREQLPPQSVAFLACAV